MKITLGWFEHFYIITISLIIGVIIDDAVTTYLRSIYSTGFVAIWGDLILGLALFAGAYIQLHFTKSR